MKYKIHRTDTANQQIHSIILYIAENFGKETALEKLDELESLIFNLSENPWLGVKPGYAHLRRQGFRVLILKRNLIFYKVNEEQKEIMIYAVVDQRQDYLNIIKGME